MSTWYFCVCLRKRRPIDLLGREVSIVGFCMMNLWEIKIRVF